MKCSGWLSALWFALVLPVSAQVTVDMAIDQDQFLPGESLPVAVRITNRSGQTLQLGRDADWLTISVESRDGYVVLKTAEVPVVGDFSLETSKRAIKRVDLAPCFNLTKPGRYSMTATVNLKGWNRQITSPPKSFDIIEGAKIWEREIGVPVAEGVTNHPPEVRTYVLQQANHLRKSLVLYFRLTDPAGKVNKVFALGPMLSFGQPDPQVDRLNHLHVLYQNGPHSFSYTVINPDGDITTRQTYEFTTRPRLKVDSHGNVSVVGGTLRDSSPEAPTATSDATNAPPPAAPAPAPAP